MASKRPASGPQGDKDNIKGFGMASTPDDKPLRLNAAQLANRKIKDIRKRRVAPSSPGFGAPQVTPFSSINANGGPSFSSSQPQPSANGFTFGQSHSFPGAGTNSVQPRQNGSTPFTFGSGGGASTFSFNSSFGSIPSVPNPFANISSGGANQTSSASSFSSFNGSTFGFGGSDSQTASSQQTLPSAGIFGSQTSSTASGLLPEPPTSTATTSSFSHSTFGPTSSHNIFTQSTPTKPSPFTQAASGNDDCSMHTSPDARENNMTTKPPIFGTSQVKQPIFGPSAGSNTTAAASNAPTTASTPLDSPSPKPRANLFQLSNPFQGLASSTSAFKTPDASKGPEGKGILSTSTDGFRTSMLSSSQPPNSSTLFTTRLTGANEESSEGVLSASGTSLFSASQPLQTSSLFAPKPTSSEQAPSVGTTAGFSTSLFGASQLPATNSLFSTESSSYEQKSSAGTAAGASTSLFGTSQPLTTSSLFASKSKNSGQVPPTNDKDSASTPLFGIPQPSATASLFSSKPTNSEQTPSIGTKAGAGTPLFGAPEPSSTSSHFVPSLTNSEQAPSEGTTAIAGTPVSGSSQLLAASNLFTPNPENSEGSKQITSKVTAHTSLFGTPQLAAKSDTFTSKPTRSTAKETSNGPTVNSHSGVFSPKPDAGNLFAQQTKSPVEGSQETTQGGLQDSNRTPAVTVKKNMLLEQSNLPSSASPLTAKQDSTRTLESLKPRKLPSNLPKELEEDYILLFQVRTLNECFKREVTKLDPSEDDFDRIIQLYTRVRKTLGIPLGFRKSKRKGLDELENADDDHKSIEGPPSSKRTRSIGTVSPGQDATGVAFAEPNPKITPSSATGIASSAAEAHHPSSASHKRKLMDESLNEAVSEDNARREKRAKEATTVVDAFAESFTNSALPGHSCESTDAGNSKGSTLSPSSRPTAGPVGSSLFSTTPTTSPVKPVFPASLTDTNTISEVSPFTQSSRTVSETVGLSPGTVFEIPKFGSGMTSGTDFLSQFKKQAEQNAAKDKEKRKEEDYDSEEDDEAEWERKDAEERRKKLENFATLAQRRSKFIPGKGFIFEDESNDTVAPNVAESKEADPKGTGPEEEAKGFSSALGEDKPISESKGKAPARENNIFGHLSPTPFTAGSNSPTSVPSALSSGFSFGSQTPQNPSLLAPSAANSEASRASTPGIASDTGAEETGDSEAAESLPQVEFARSGAGEENEDVMLEIRARALQFKDGSWESQGVGFLRILKDRTTSRARILLRADPSGKVVLNALLLKELDYQLTGTSVTFMVPQPEGALQKWAIRAKKEEVEKLAKEMQAQKS